MKIYVGDDKPLCCESEKALTMLVNSAKFILKLVFVSVLGDA